jgi:pilus assembly protein CpaB
MKRRIIGVIAAVVLAIVGTAFLVIYVRGAEDRALAGQETAEVLVVTGDIERGTAAEELGDRVVTERIPAKVRAEGSIATLDDLDGQVTSVDLVPGEQLVVGRFTTPVELEAERDVEVPEGLQELTISLAPQRAVGGRITPGDTVGLFASFNLSDQRDEEQIANETSEELRQQLSETTKMILHKVLVTNVQVEQLPPAAGDDDADRTGPDLAPTGNLLITLAVDVAQAERIVFTAEHGLIWLSAEPDEADESGGLLRTPRIIYDD